MARPNSSGSWRSLALPALFASVPGCGAAEAPFDPGPFRSETGALEVSLSNGPFARGKNVVELCVLEKKSAEFVDGLEMEMIPFMPAMGHGSSGPSPSVALGGGCYEFRGIVLNMPGTWELRTTISGAFEDTATPTLFLR